MSYRRAKKRLKEEKKEEEEEEEEKEEEEMKEKTKHHKHNISAGFHAGIDKDNENLQDMCKNHQGLQQKKEGICKIYYLWVTVITPDICQILQENLMGN